MMVTLKLGVSKVHRVLWMVIPLSLSAFNLSNIHANLNEPLPAAADSLSYLHKKINEAKKNEKEKKEKKKRGEKEKEKKNISNEYKIKKPNKEFLNVLLKSPGIDTSTLVDEVTTRSRLASIHVADHDQVEPLLLLSSPVHLVFHYFYLILLLNQLNNNNYKTM